VVTNGIGVTNDHGIETPKAKGFCVMTGAWDVFPVKEILAADKDGDLAVFRFEIPNGKTVMALPVAAEDPVVGAPVFAVGHPDKRFLGGCRFALCGFS